MHAAGPYPVTVAVTLPMVLASRYGSQSDTAWRRHTGSAVTTCQQWHAKPVCTCSTCAHSCSGQGPAVQEIQLMWKF